MLMSFVQSHKEFVYGAVVVYACNHVPQAVLIAFHMIVKIPFIRTAIRQNPERAKKIVDIIHDAAEKVIDEEISAK